MLDSVCWRVREEVKTGQREKEKRKERGLCKRQKCFKKTQDIAKEKEMGSKMTISLFQDSLMHISQSAVAQRETERRQ